MSVSFGIVCFNDYTANLMQNTANAMHKFAYVLIVLNYKFDFSMFQDLIYGIFDKSLILIAIRHFKKKCQDRRTDEQQSDPIGVHHSFCTF